MNEELLENWAELPSLKEASTEQIAEAARAVLDAKKAADIAVIPVTGRSDITDCLVLATGNAGPHVKALAAEVEYRLSLRGLSPLHTDGFSTRSWQVVDYGTVMVHVFDKQTRDFYNLDKLYKDAAAEETTEAKSKETV